MGRLSCRNAVVLLALLGVPALATGQQPQQDGTIVGRVIDAATQQPIPDAQVGIVGGARGGRTSEDGMYRIAGVSPGTVQVRALRIGYQPSSQSVIVEPGGTATADFALAVTATTLDQVVITATGQEQRLRETGSSVSNIALEDVNLAPIQSFSQVLAGRATGVSVLQSSGTSGTGTRIRIRGANSVSLNNEPLIVVDGVRVNSAPESNSIAVGGQFPSRINDFNPDDIESVEILKGPAATGLYGTQAANGVIQITTKRGRAGRTRWNAYTEYGQLRDVNDYPANFGGYTDDFGPPALPFCDLITQSFGDCVQDSLAVFNPLMVHSPFRTGTRQQYGLSVAGGSERARYFLSGDLEDEDGVYRTNSLARANLRANVDASLRDDLEVRVSTGYLSSRLRLPGNDNTFLGYISNGLAGHAEDGPTQGYDPIGPALLDRIDTRQEVERYTGSANASWFPLDWLRFNGTAGLDVLNRFDHETFPAGAIDFFGLGIGSREANRIQIGTYTANIAGTATFAVRPDLTSTTTAGFQFQRDLFRGTFASGEGLTAGSGGLGGTTSRFQVDETQIENILVGGLISQQFGFRDRFFVSVGVRGDDNSAFGENFGVIYYPSGSLSWVISEEGFFPQTDLVSSLRLRAALGESGLRPGNRDAIVFFNPVAARIDGTDSPGITLGGIGDPNLRPERTREIELGVDASLLAERIGLELTYFNKRSRDALIARRTPASVGNPVTRFQNLGSVTNQGLEALLTLQIIERPEFQWNVALTGSTLRNRLTELGEGIAPIIFGFDATQRHVEGYSLGAYWDVPITGFADADGSGIIEFDEIEYGDTAVFLGNSLPTRIASINTDLTLFRWIRVGALLDYRGGYKQYNSSETFRCAILRCRGVNDASAPLEQQARSVAAAFGVNSGYIEDASFMKLREVTVTFTAPSGLARRLGTDGLSLTLAGRNLGTWTDYSGLDPELNALGQANFSQAEFLTQPQVRTFAARLNFAF